jgi:hypothetical protein
MKVSTDSVGGIFDAEEKLCEGADPLLGAKLFIR